MADGFDSAEALSWRSGIVTVPSWVGLVGGADYNRRGAVGEGFAGNGQFAVSSGSTMGLAAPAAGNLAPSVNPEARRTASLRSASNVGDEADLRFTAGMTDSRETLLVAPEAPALGERHRTAAGFGSTLGLFDQRVRLGGEFAGARLHDGFADPAGEHDRTGIAQRLNGEATLLETGDTRFGVNGFHQSAHAGYTVPSGVVPDWTNQGVGARLAIGPIAFGLQADRAYNNLDRDPAMLTFEEHALRPSFGLSLEELRPPVEAGAGAFSFGRLIPSAVRIDHSALQVTGTPEPGGTLSPADVIRQRIRRSAIAFDWRWDRATTTLALAGDDIDSVQAGKEDQDSAGRGLWFSHAIGGNGLAATVAVGMRRAESFEPGNRSETESFDLSAAFARRNFILGDLVTSFAVHQARHDALDAAYTDIDTTWQARAAFDIAELPSVTDDGRLTMAVSFNGNDPDLDSEVRLLDVVFGLAAQMRF